MCLYIRDVSPHLLFAVERMSLPRGLWELPSLSLPVMAGQEDAEDGHGWKAKILPFSSAPLQLANTICLPVSLAGNCSGKML